MSLLLLSAWSHLVRNSIVVERLDGRRNEFLRFTASGHVSFGHNYARPDNEVSTGGCLDTDVVTYLVKGDCCEVLLCEFW